MIIIPNELRYGDGVGYPLSSHAFALEKGVRVNFFMIYQIISHLFADYIRDKSVQNI